MVKRSLSFPPDVFAALEAEASEEHTTVSALVTEAARRLLVARAGMRAVAQWEAEHGALTADELAAADRELDAAGTS